MTSSGWNGRPAALITGAGRLDSIGAGIVQRLARDGWNLALSYWQSPDAPADESGDPERLAALACLARERRDQLPARPGVDRHVPVERFDGRVEDPGVARLRVGEDEAP